MPSLQEVLRDPNYINANEATKRAIFERHAPLDQNYTGANEATQAAIRQRFGIGQMGMPVAAPEQPTTGAFAAGVKSYLPQVQETFGGLKTLLGVGAERVLGEGQISRGLIESGAASMKEAEAKRQPYMTAERGSFTDALNKGVGAVLTEWLPYQAGSGAMQLLESLGLMGAGAIAGSALPGAGTLAGAGTGLVARELAKKGVKEAAEKILKEKGEDAAQAYFENEAKKAARKIGGTAAIGAQAAFYGTGQTTSRAVEEAEKLGGTATDIELARVLPAAAVSTVAEFIGDKIALGALKGIKPGEPGKFVAADLAKNILLNIGLTGTKEVPVEVIQSAAERFGAKLSLTDAQALKEYIDATAASYGMAVGPGGVGGVRQTMAERAKKPEAPAPEAPPVAPLVSPEVEPEKPMITRVMDMASQQNGYGLLEQQKQRLLAEPQTEDIKKELTFIQEIQDRMNIETAQRLKPSGKSPFTITPDALTELGIKPTAPIIKRINGKAYDDPYVIEQLEKFAANKNVDPEVQQSVLAFVEQLRQPVEPPAAPVSEAPPAPPVAPPVEPPAPPVTPPAEPPVTPPAPPVEPAPVVEAAAPTIPELRQRVEQADELSEEWQTRIDDLKNAVAQDIKQTLDANEMPVFVSKSGLTSVITPSAQQGGMFQLTRYNQTGAVGDSQYRTIEEAITDNNLQDANRLDKAKAEEHMAKLVEAEAAYQSSKKPAPAVEAPTPELTPAEVAQQIKDLKDQQTKLLTKAGKVPAPRSPARQKYDALSAQIADLEGKQLTVRSQKPRKRPSTIMGSPMLAGIFNQLGGLHTSLLSEFSTRFITKRIGRKGKPIVQMRNPLVPGYGTLFNKDGKVDFGEIAEYLEQEGYLEPGSLERDYKDAGERAKDLIKQALNREEVLPIQDRIDRDAQEREESERQRTLDRQEENRMIASGELQLEPEFEWTDEEIEKNLGLDREFETDLEMYDLEPKDLEFLSDEELESELTDAEREQAQARRTRKAEEDAARQKAEGAAPGEAEEILTRPTAEGLKAKQEEAEQAAAAEKKAKAAEQERLRKEQQAKEEKARADESAKDFELGKSAEEQMTGMGDLFLSIEPTIKSDRLPSLKRGVDNVIKIYEKGWLSTDEFAIRINTLANQIETAKLAKEQAGRQRGADFLRQRLLEAKRRGELSEEAIDFAEWFILQNPKLVDDLGISIRTPKEDGVGGMYSAYNRVMYLMKNRGSETTVVHEILHHLERMMPKEVQSAIRKTWIKSLMEAQKNAKTEADKTFFKNLTDFHFEGGRPVLLQEAIFAIKEGNVSKELYQYTSPSEFWAENASEIMKGRFDVKGSVLGRLKQWLSELKEKARSLFGLENKAAIIRALDSLSKGDGQFVSKNLLDDSKETRQVVKEVRKSGEDRATANFLRWFGDSKVVDEKGEPLVVYHGTGSDIDAFRGRGRFYFAEKPEYAASFAGKYFDEYKRPNIMPVYLSVQKPLDLTALGGDFVLTNDIVAALEKAGAIKTAQAVKDRQFEKYGRKQGVNVWELWHESPIREAVKDDGFDGVIQIEQAAKDESSMHESRVVMVFNPTQIKSAIGNNGDYSLTNADIRKSIGGVSPGQKALETIRSMGMDVPKPDETKLEKAKDIWKKAKEDPKLTAQSALKAARDFMDKVETWAFSPDAKLNNDFRRAVIKDFKENEGVLGQLLEMSQSQAVHADALSSQFLIDGGLKYNDKVQKWESFESKANFPALSKKLDEIGEKYSLSKEQIERVAHAYLVAKRLPGLIERNKNLDAEIAAEQASIKPDKKKIKDLEDKKVFISEKQLEQIEPGLSLVKDIPELNQVVDMWNEIRKNTIDVMVNSGLWSTEYAQQMWDNMDYVPYFRDDQIENEAGPQEFIRGLQVKSKEFQLKGSEDAVHDVFDNMIRWTQYAINRSVRAHKALQMIDNAKDIQIGDRKMAEKVTEEKRGMNIARVFRDGKQELYDMADPMYVQAFSAIQNVSIPTIKFMAQVSNVLRQSVVLYPLFSVAQVPQDAFAAMFTSGLKTQHALKIPYLAVKEFIKTLNKTSATHNTLKKFGATGVRDFSATVIRDDAEIYAGLKPPRGGWGKTKEVLSHISMAADNAVRQAVYEASMQQGVKQSEAIEKAFDVINFRRKGTSKMLNILGQTVPFFYAYLSAQRVALKVLTGTGISPTDRKEAFQTLATTSAAVATLSLLYAMANGDDEDYMETPANIRDRTLTIPGSGGVRIPLRPDFFLFPKIIAEHTYLMLSDQGYQDGAKFRKSMADALLSAVASPTPFPTAIKPAIEVAINYDFFQGKPLIGNFEKQKDIERQFRDSTSELAKILSNVPLSYSLEKGKFEGLSPIAIDHMIRGMFGSFGGLLLFGTNQFLHSDPDVPRPELSAGEMLTALPGTSGLLKRPQESALKNDFYTLRDEVEKAVNTFNDIKTRSPQGMEDFLADEKKMARYMLGKPVDQINQRLSKIRRQMTIITNMPENQMSAEDKAENIRQLREFEREYLKSVDVKALREMAKI